MWGMNSISHIRERLGVTQSAMGIALGKTQGNISNYEAGQNMPPDVAKRLIEYAGTLGVVVTLDDIYSSSTSPALAARRATDPTPSPGHAGRQPASPHLILDTVPSCAVIVVGAEGDGV